MKRSVRGSLANGRLREYRATLHRALPCLLIALSGYSAMAESAPRSTALADPRWRIDTQQDEFTLIVLPDTQKYAAHFPEILRAQTQWVRDHVADLSIKFVIHVGDVVDRDTLPEWRTADGAFALLDGAVPYLVVPGNHDYPNPLQDMGIKAAANFNAVFSPYRFRGRAWFGGSRQGSAENTFSYFEAAGRKYLVMGLEHGPPDEVLAWADTVLRTHEDTHHVILATHAYMNHDDTRLGEADDSNPRKDDPRANDGEQIWQKLVRRHDRIDLVLSGHVLGDGTGLLISKTDGGHPVVQMLSNYQMEENGGRGWLRVLKIRPRRAQLEVYTYSPWLGRFREEADQQFTIAAPWMFEPTAQQAAHEANGPSLK